ncbi:unnamed protein product [Schistosoma curassoni]|uniref:Uncharacterized protein n=1 Tax=Schistosoma curassoni TaxID=6186 RepID=A0A183JKC0_9TREM|nr:unnamed protein product [Schistosoma curassoni]
MYTNNYLFSFNKFFYRKIFISKILACTYVLVSLRVFKKIFVYVFPNL